MTLEWETLLGGLLPPACVLHMLGETFCGLFLP